MCFIYAAQRIECTSRQPLLSMNAQSVLPAFLHAVHSNPVILPSHLTRLSLQFLQAIIDLFLIAFTYIHIAPVKLP